MNEPRDLMEASKAHDSHPTLALPLPLPLPKLCPALVVNYQAASTSQAVCKPEEEKVGWLRMLLGQSPLPGEGTLVSWLGEGAACLWCRDWWMRGSGFPIQVFRGKNTKCQRRMKRTCQAALRGCVWRLLLECMNLECLASDPAYFGWCNLLASEELESRLRFPNHLWAWRFTDSWNLK